MITIDHYGSSQRVYRGEQLVGSGYSRDKLPNLDDYDNGRLNTLGVTDVELEGYSDVTMLPDIYSHTDNYLLD